MLVESANIPMPSEATMLFAGFKVDEGDLTLFGITAAGVLGNVVGSWAGYAIGYYGRRSCWSGTTIFHVSPKQMARVEGWFERYGAVTVFFTRMLPIVRTFISTPAGAAHMPFWKFTVYTAAGCIPWVLLLGFIGVEVGENWEEWRDKLHYFDYVVIVGHPRPDRLLPGQVGAGAARRPRTPPAAARPSPPPICEGAPVMRGCATARPVRW